MKKVFLAILCCLMLVTSIIGCKNNNSESTTLKITKENGQTTSGSDATNSALPEDLVFNNQEVNILLRNTHLSEFSVDSNGGLIDEAIYDRNRMVEERLKVKLNYIALTDAAPNQANYLANIRSLYQSGIKPSEGGYHIVTSHVYYGAALAVEGIYYNFLKFDLDNYLDTSNPWYNQSFVTDNVVNECLYFSVGDANLTATDRSVVTFMNKTEAHSQGIGDIDYIKIVNDGMWTLEYLKNLTKDIYRDVDSNGKSLDDYYGLGIMKGSANVDAVMTACGIQITNRKADGTYELAVDTANNERAYSAMYDFYYNEVDGIKVFQPSFIIAGDYNGTEFQYNTDQKFSEGKLVFGFGLLQSAKGFAKTALSYQILPLPKLDEDMPEYYTTPQDSYSLISVMGNSREEDLAVATATLECLSEYSYRVVRPAYYQTAFKTLYASDSDTAVLFDRIINNIHYSFGNVNSASLSNVLHVLRDSFTGHPDFSDGTLIPAQNLAGIWAKHGASVTTKFNELIENYGSYN